MSSPGNDHESDPALSDADTAWDAEGGAAGPDDDSDWAAEGGAVAEGPATDPEDA